jgi:hypothetical protein
MYQVLTLRDPRSDPVALWGLTKKEAMSRLHLDMPLHSAIRAFHNAVWDYYPDEDSLEDALAVIQTGLAFLQAAKAWWSHSQLTGQPVVPVRGPET